MEEVSAWWWGKESAVLPVVACTLLSMHANPPTLELKTCACCSSRHTCKPQCH